MKVYSRFRFVALAILFSACGGGSDINSGGSAVSANTNGTLNCEDYASAKEIQNIFDYPIALRTFGFGSVSCGKAWPASSEISTPSGLFSLNRTASADAAKRGAEATCSVQFYKEIERVAIGDTSACITQQTMDTTNCTLQLTVVKGSTQVQVSATSADALCPNEQIKQLATLILSRL